MVPISPTATAPTFSEDRKAKLWTFVALGAILALVAIIRMRLATSPLERDEGEYAYIGQLMLQGIPPYKEAANMKFPGTYAAYAVIEADVKIGAIDTCAQRGARSAHVMGGHRSNPRPGPRRNGPWAASLDDALRRNPYSKWNGHVHCQQHRQGPVGAVLGC